MNPLKCKNEDGKFLTYNQTANKSNLGKCTVMKLAREAGALIKIGRPARVDWDTIYNYVMTVYRGVS